MCNLWCHHRRRLWMSISFNTHMDSSFLMPLIIIVLLRHVFWGELKSQGTCAEIWLLLHRAWLLSFCPLIITSQFTGSCLVWWRMKKVQNGSWDLLHFMKLYKRTRCKAPRIIYFGTNQSASSEAKVNPTEQTQTLNTPHRQCEKKKFSPVGNRKKIDSL
jgi:hypothetical protein